MLLASVASCQDLALATMASRPLRLKKMLLAASKAVEAGNMIVFGADLDAIKKLAKEKRLDQHIIMHKATGRQTKMVYKDGLYKLPLWIRRRIRKKSVSSGMQGSHFAKPGVSHVTPADGSEDAPACQGCFNEDIRTCICNCGDGWPLF